MGPLEIIAGILLIITSVFLIVVVAMQEHNTSMGSLAGQEQYSSKNQSKTLDVMLSKATKGAAIVFFALTLVLNLLVIYIK